MRSRARTTATCPVTPCRPGLSPVADVAALSGAEAILLAVPMQALRGLVEAEAETLAPHRLVACCKGVELGTTLGPAEVLAKALPGRPPPS